MGRPEKRETERRGETIRLRVSSSENAKVLADARAAGLTVPDYLRGRLGLEGDPPAATASRRRKAKGVPAAPKDEVELAARELRRLTAREEARGASPEVAAERARRQGIR